MKIYTFPNFADALLFNGYEVENPLYVSARSNEFCVKYSFHLLLNPIMDNRIKILSNLFVRPETRFNREPLFY
jgi:hypothetical protein